MESRSSEDKGTFNEQQETQRSLKKRRVTPEKQVENSEDPTGLRFIELPTEIHVHILRHLKEDDLLRTRGACKTFKDLTSTFVATLCPDYKGKGALIANQNVESFTQLTEIIINLDDENSPEEIAEAYFGLGELYLMGVFKNPNYQKAIKYYNQSIKLGYQYAWVRKGLIYEEGLGGLKDSIAAKYHYKMAGYGNREYAIWQLANRFRDDNDDFRDDDFLQDYSKAFELLKNLANENYNGAHYTLGYMYENGEGVEPDIRMAQELYHKAAEQGDRIAQWLLGAKYEGNEWGEPDYSLAVYWYQQAAEQGEMAAQYPLAKMYEEGKGVEQNYSLAVHWYQQAAKQGDKRAQYALAKMYKEGKGVKKISP
ncbi:MAG: F-box/SEL1-like repeat protein [Candidatus Paracaedibacteraceae bacterium]|nr:F-box/SEL1-like repeat protein [Candidatus Paracaedibacteraceae bacterium]